MMALEVDVRIMTKYGRAYMTVMARDEKAFETHMAEAVQQLGIIEWTRTSTIIRKH